jgi:DNA invertase Pin-like site-specific DNA recombinase
MRVGYGRVSTVEQNLDLQMDALTRAGCERIFTEHASGAQRDRPELAAALKYMREGDVLVVWRLDRLARSLIQLIETVEDLQMRGIGFQSVTEAIDTTTPAGRLTFHIFGAMAEFERGIVRERTMAGLAAAKARGRRGGRPSALDADKHKIAHALIQDGQLTIKQIAAHLRVAPSTLYAHGLVRSSR